MTPENVTRILELANLITAEDDPEKIKLLAAEMKRLLMAEGKWLPRSGGKPKNS